LAANFLYSPVFGFNCLINEQLIDNFFIQSPKEEELDTNHESTAIEVTRA